MDHLPRTKKIIQWENQIVLRGEKRKKKTEKEKWQRTTLRLPIVSSNVIFAKEITHTQKIKNLFFHFWQK